MKPTRRLPSWSVGPWASLLLYFLHGIRFAEGSSDDVLLVFCQCPFGYYQASKFPVLLQFTPPCGEMESTRSPTLCGRWKTYGLKCVRCHPNCVGCDGPTDAHCDACSEGLFNASYILSEPMLPGPSEGKRTSSSENLQFFNEDELMSKLLNTEAPARKQRGQRGNRRKERKVRDLNDDTTFFDSGEINSADVTTDVAEEQGIDDDPRNDEGKITTRVPQLSDVIEEEELIPLTTPLGESVQLRDSRPIVFKNSEKANGELIYTTKQSHEADDMADSGSGDEIIDEDLRAQLASPSSNPPPQRVVQRHPPTPSNYWYPDTTYPVPVKRSGGVTDQLASETVGVQEWQNADPSSLPTPAALFKPSSTRTRPPQALVGLPPRMWDNIETTASTLSVTEPSVTYSYSQTPPSVRSTQRRPSTSDTSTYTDASTPNSKNNSSERRSSGKRRFRTTTVQPPLNENSEGISFTTAKSTHLQSRSTVRDIWITTKVANTTTTQDIKPNITSSAEDGTSERSFLTTLTDPVSPREFTKYFRCVAVCPEGTYKDRSAGVCQICDSKCRTCVGPSFMNCTSCSVTAVQAASSPPKAQEQPVTVTCLSGCPGNHFVYNGTCTPCHDFCDGCFGFGPAQCLACRYPITKGKSDKESHSSTPHPACENKVDDPESPLELILPLSFVAFLFLVTAIICIRWNCKASDICSYTQILCHKLKKKEKENFSSLPKKLATSGKIRNEYSPSPPTGTCPKCQVNTTDDGYELPLHPPSVASGSNYTPASMHSSTSSASHTMIKPRRNDPLPLTPLELDAIQRRANTPNSNVYKNVPQTQTVQDVSHTSDIEAIPGTSSQSDEENRFSDRDKQHLVLTDASYANSEGLYANC